MFKKVNKLLSSFTDLGFTEVFDTGLNNSGKLDKIKLHIYNLTKNYLIDHDLNIDLDSKLKIPFKQEVDENFLNFFLRSINNDNELQKIIDCEEVVDKFKLIFHKPIKYQFFVLYYHQKFQNFIHGIKMRAHGIYLKINISKINLWALCGYQLMGAAY